MKNLPRTLVLKQLINHKDKVRRRASRILAPARSPPPDRPPPRISLTRCLPPNPRFTPLRNPLLSSRATRRTFVCTSRCASATSSAFSPPRSRTRTTRRSSPCTSRSWTRCGVWRIPRRSAFQPAHATLRNGIAAIGLCVPMLDLECPGADRLVDDLFEVMFQSVNPTNSSLVEEDVTKVLGTMLEEAEEMSPGTLGAILSAWCSPRAVKTRGARRRVRPRAQVREHPAARAAAFPRGCHQEQGRGEHVL